MVIKALNSAVTGMEMQQKKIDVISNNLANIGTPGYKSSEAFSQTLLYVDNTRVGTNPGGDVIIPSGVQIGLGTQLASVAPNVEQGELKNTGSQYDLAIIGNGYFSILLPDGSVAYTRAGNFKLSPSGQLVTIDGNIVQPGITIPDGTIDVTVSDTGVVSTKASGSVEWTQQGTIELTTFINEAGLIALGKNLFQESEASGPPITGAPKEENRGSIQQHWLEMANVNPIKELTDLITAQRGYEMGSKVIQTADEMMQIANSSKK